jgi:hypothetical protein
MDVSQYDSYTQWKAEEDRDCLELYPTKVGTKWTANLRPSWTVIATATATMSWHGPHSTCTSEALQLDKENEYDGLEDGTWDELAETTFNMSFRSV